MTEHPRPDELPLFPARREDPLVPPRVYDEWRAETAAKRVRLADGREAWAITRHDDVREMLTEGDLEWLTANRFDPKFPNLRQGVIALGQDSNVVFMDEPEHGVMRRMLAPQFTHRRATEMRPGIQRVVDEVIDAMLQTPTQSGDLHALFSLAIPSKVICELLGAPYEDHHVFEAVTGSLLSRSTTADQYKTNLGQLKDYISALVDRKHAGPPENDLICTLLEFVDTGELRKDQVVGLSMLMIIAGHETTATTISMLMLQLLAQREQWEALTRDQSRVMRMIEEGLRRHSINDLVTLRLAKTDFEIGGCPIKKGDGVFNLNGAGNHDPAIFPDPTTYDPSRENLRKHLGFGVGVHVCIGQNLARAELEIALATLARRVPTLRLTAAVDDLDYKHDGFVFGVRELPVAW